LYQRSESREEAVTVSDENVSRIITQKFKRRHRFR